jgi:hypothetical protein
MNCNVVRIICDLQAFPLSAQLNVSILLGIGNQDLPFAGYLIVDKLMKIEQKAEVVIPLGVHMLLLN